MKTTINNQLAIIETATFTVKAINGTECYKEQNGRYYHCFVNNNAAFNNGIKYVRISAGEYKTAREEKALAELN